MGLVPYLFSDLCFLSVAYVLNGHTSTESPPLTSYGGIDLPPENEIKASFPSSLCYFEMQPTGRGTRMEVGNRPFSGAEGLNGNNSEAQIPNPTAAESRSLILRT